MHILLNRSTYKIDHGMGHNKPLQIKKRLKYLYILSGHTTIKLKTYNNEQIFRKIHKLMEI